MRNAFGVNARAGRAGGSDQDGDELVGPSLDRGLDAPQASLSAGCGELGAFRIPVPVLCSVFVFFRRVL
jgi:hypothetical protein